MTTCKCVEVTLATVTNCSLNSYQKALDCTHGCILTVVSKVGAKDTHVWRSNDNSRNCNHMTQEEYYAKQAVKAANTAKAHATTEKTFTQAEVKSLTASAVARATATAMSKKSAPTNTKTSSGVPPVNCKFGDKCTRKDTCRFKHPPISNQFIDLSGVGAPKAPAKVQSVVKLVAPVAAPVPAPKETPFEQATRETAAMKAELYDLIKKQAEDKAAKAAAKEAKKKAKAEAAAVLLLEKEQLDIAVQMQKLVKAAYDEASSTLPDSDSDSDPVSDSDSDL